ncbi:DNA-binding heavy metal response regulator [Aquipluma nitroreducens]|uniref:DNA-binding heavy metal response regulator n=1 Tax=Aquipluma nitroreducens TaxID=2010828 RepID=A0A5K7SH79_9BACT|nr:response regulator transcription factor [Aquipluma nitroreducens]BBE20807.1 DNA-binding heavy metal response regulator [Aquipluma nitroreducens]
MNQLNAKILVVEDEPKVASFVKRGLEENEFYSEIASDGLMGKRMFDSGDYDLILLDLNLPYKNGIELCKEIRSSDQKIPILMLTALGTTEDKLSGFDSGADDYLVKPFEFRELLARIRALLKRTSIAETGGNILTLLDLSVNLNTYEVTRSGKKIDLTQKEFALLVYLLRNKGKVVSRMDIAENVWDINFDTGTNIIDVYVNFLRKKMDKDFSQKLIHTQTGVGYILKD